MTKVFSRISGKEMMKGHTTYGLTDFSVQEIMNETATQVGKRFHTELTFIHSEWDLDTRELVGHFTDSGPGRVFSHEAIVRVAPGLFARGEVFTITSKVVIRFHFVSQDEYTQRRKLRGIRQTVCSTPVHTYYLNDPEVETMAVAS